MGRKRIIITVIITVLLVIFAQPLYSTANILMEAVNSRNNKTVRIDLFKNGDADNRLIFSEMSKFVFSKDRCLDGKQKAGCYALEGGLKSKWREYQLKMKAATDGEILLVLKSPLKGGNVTQTDFRRLKVNGKEVFGEEKAFSVQNPYEYRHKLKKDEVLQLSFEARRHHFSLADLNEANLNYKMLLTVIVISFLLSFKLVAYAAKFKLAENNSRIDIVFLCVFFALLFIPITKIDRSVNSAKENRRLAVYKPLLSPQGLNNKFGQNFEAWFNDRFNGRDAIISFYSSLQMHLNSKVNGKVAFFNKKTHWLFRNGHLKQRILPKTQEDEILQELKIASDFFSQNGIKVYMMMVPAKIDVYAKEAEPYYKLKGPQDTYTIERMRKELPFPVVYPLAELQEGAKKDFVFFKTEHHWTEWGAYLGYRQLMQEVIKDFPEVKITDENSYHTFYERKVRGDWDRAFTLGQTFILMNVKYPEKKLLDVKYKYYTPKTELKPVVNSTQKTKHYHNPKGSGLRAMVIGTSMSENLLQFLPQSFSELKYFRTNSKQVVPVSEEEKIMKYYRQEILDFKPDVVIFCFTVSNIPGFVKFNMD